MSDRIKQVFNWSNYQDKQLDVLNRLETSFNRSLELSNSTAGNLSSLSVSMLELLNSTRTLTQYINNLTASRGNSSASMNNLNQTIIGVSNSSRSLIDSQTSLKTIYDSQGKVLSDLIQRELELKRIEEERAAEEEKRRAEEEAEGKKMRSDVSSAIQYIWDSAIKLFSTMGKAADNFSTSSNNLIQISGMNGAAVKSFRSDFVDQVNKLNDTTGSLYSPQEAYQKIVSISQAVTSDLSSLSEMARPLLLASETLPDNLENIADIFNRFYVRYNFSSANMEETLDKIRGNTAGNSANAQATLENIKSLETWVGVIAGNDNNKRTSMLEDISNYTSWLESMGLNSSVYTDYINKIAWGDFDDQGLTKILTTAGLSPTSAQDMVRSGDFDEVTKYLVEGLASTADQLIDSRVSGKALDNQGLDRTLAVEAYNVINSTGWKSLEDFLTDAVNTSTEMEKLAEDKYVSATDKMNHNLENIYLVVANIQESLGTSLIGGTDAANLMTTAASAYFGYKTLKKGYAGLKGLSGGASSASAASTGASASSASAAGAGGASSGGASTGLLSKAGSAIASNPAAAGGVAVGVAGAIYGYNEAYEQYKEGDYGHATGNAVGATAMAGGAVVGGAILAGGLSNAWNPVGWALIIAGGATLIGTALHDAYTTIGSAVAVEQAYEQAAAAIHKSAKKNEQSLLEIQHNLTNNIDIEKQREELINSGLLSERDVEKARTANIDGLKKLTDTYIKSNAEISSATQSALQGYKRSNAGYIREVQKNLDEVLGSLNDNDGLKDGSSNLQALEAFMISLYESMSDRSAAGEVFNEDTQMTYENLVEAVGSDYKLSSSEANDILDEGWFNTVFRNSNLGSQELLTAIDIMGQKNSSGAVLKNQIMSSVQGKTFTDLDTVVDVTSAAERAKYATDQLTAIGILDDLKSKGYTSSQWKEIGEAADKWGLTGYATGSNYITHDQIAVLHEGEAVVPRKYNPAVNSYESKQLVDKIEESNDDTAEYFLSFLEELRELKTFLAEWRLEKSRRDTANEIKNKFSESRSFIQQYMTY